MFQRAVALDATVAAMMVGQEQSFRRNDLARTTASENDDGIFQGS